MKLTIDLKGKELGPAVILWLLKHGGGDLLNKHLATKGLKPVSMSTQGVLDLSSDEVMIKMQ